MSVRRLSKTGSTRLAALGLLLCLQPAAGQAGVDLAQYDSESAIDTEIERLQSQDSGLAPRDHYLLGALYYIKRDYAHDLYTRNKLAIESGKHFFAYKQEHALGAQKNIALFCIDRIRQAPSAGRSPGEDVDRCSVIVSSYFAADGAVKPDFTMEEVILEAMADELLYDVAHRNLRWRSTDIVSLVEALEQARLSRKQAPEIEQALLDNIANRLSMPVEADDMQDVKAVYLEGFRLADYLLARDIDEARRTRVQELRSAAESTPGGQAAVSLAMIEASTELMEKARNSVSSHRILRGALPRDLEDTSFRSQDLPDFVAGLDISGDTLVLRYAPGADIPEPLRARALVWELEKSGSIVKSRCSRRTTVSEANLRAALGCPAPR